MLIPFLDINVDNYVTKSGIKVYVINDVNAQSFYASHTTNFGSNDLDICNEHGIAHFLEHVMFAKKDGDYFDDFSKYNASANAYTSYNQTTYLFTCDDYFDKNIEILSELVSTNYFSEATVKKEFEIISEEIKIYDNEPFWKLRNLGYESICQNSNYKIDIAGTIESITDITKAKLDKIFTTAYVNSNQYIVMYGNFTEQLIDHSLSLFDVCKGEYESKKPVENSEVNFEKKFLELASVDTNYGLTTLKFGVNKKDTVLEYISFNVFLESYFTDLSDQFLSLKKTEQISPSTNFSAVFEHDLRYLQFSYQGDNLELNHKAILKYFNEVKLDSELLGCGLNNLKSYEIYENDNLENFAKSFVHHIDDCVDVVEFYKLLEVVTVEEIVSCLELIRFDYKSTLVAIVKENYNEN